MSQSRVAPGGRLGAADHLLADLGGGSSALPLGGRQTEEMLLTATQTVLGVAVLLALRFPHWAAWTLLGLFAVQFAIPGQHGRYLISIVYAILAVLALVRNRHALLPTLVAPFQRELRSDTIDRELSESRATTLDNQLARSSRPGACLLNRIDARGQADGARGRRPSTDPDLQP